MIAGGTFASLGCRDDPSIVAGCQRKPGAHLVRPAHHARAARLDAEGERGPPRGPGGSTVPGVKLKAADEEGEPSGQFESVSLLAQCEAPVLELDEATQPLPPSDMSSAFWLAYSEHNLSTVSWIASSVESPTSETLSRLMISRTRR